MFLIPHLLGTSPSLLVAINRVGEQIIETGTPIPLLELADVNEETRTFGKGRDKAESPGIIPLCEPALLLHCSPKNLGPGSVDGHSGGGENACAAGARRDPATLFYPAHPYPMTPASP